MSKALESPNQIGSVHAQASKVQLDAWDEAKIPKSSRDPGFDAAYNVFMKAREAELTKLGFRRG